MLKGAERVKKGVKRHRYTPKQSKSVDRRESGPVTRE